MMFFRTLAGISPWRLRLPRSIRSELVDFSFSRSMDTFRRFSTAVAPESSPLALYTNSAISDFFSCLGRNIFWFCQARLCFQFYFKDPDYFPSIGLVSPVFSQDRIIFPLVSCRQPSIPHMGLHQAPECSGSRS